MKKTLTEVDAATRTDGQSIAVGKIRNRILDVGLVVFSVSIVPTALANFSPSVVSPAARMTI